MAVESQVYALAAAHQSAKGSPASDPTQRLVMTGGDLDATRSDGTENFSDLDRFGNMTDYVDTLVGEGSPVIQATPNELAYLCWLFFGTEVYTAAVADTTPPKYVFEPGASTGGWSTWWKRVGQTSVVRRQFNDCKLTAMRFEGSSSAKVVKATPTIISLDPGVFLSADPTWPDMPVIDPFIYTEGAGQFTVDGTVLSGHSQFAVVCDDGSAPYYGDDSVPYDVVPGTASITLDGITFLLDSVSLAKYNNIVYGTASPSDNAKPVRNLQTTPLVGSYSCLMSRGATDQKVSFKIEVPKVHWAPDVPVAPNPDGGPIEIALAGSMRKGTTTPKSIRITVETGAGDDAAHSA